jgi:hypothetical protein
LFVMIFSIFRKVSFEDKGVGVGIIYLLT